MELDRLTMEPIEETSIAIMEESTSTTVELLELMMNETGGGSDDDSGILDRGICMSMHNNENQAAAADDDDDEMLAPGNRYHKITVKGIANKKTKPTVQSHHNVPSCLSTMKKRHLQPPCHLATTATRPAMTPQTSRYNTHDNFSANVVSPLTMADEDENNSRDNARRQHNSRDTSSFHASFCTSPTIDTTPAGMASMLSDMSSIQGEGTTVHGAVAGDELIMDVSPTSTHVTQDRNFPMEHVPCSRHSSKQDSRNQETNNKLPTTGNQAISQEQQRQHNDQEDEMTPEDLLGRLQNDHHEQLMLISPASQYDNKYNAKDEQAEGLISRRLQELEVKKVALHQKRISLEHRLYDFVDSEKRMRLMIGQSSSGNSPISASSSASLASQQSLLMNQSLQSTPSSLLRPPTPNSHKTMQRKLQRQNPTFHVHQNGDEMVQDYPWRDPRAAKINNGGKYDNVEEPIAYYFSGTLNKLKQPHGVGVMKFSDGQVYEGQCYAGYRWGLGTNRWPDGQVYVGEWDDHSRNGRGTHTWKDGRKVTGQWSGGHLNGRVIFSWPNGASFDGECRMGKKHGRGTHTWANGRLYSGHFVNGKEHGFGSLTQSDWKYRGNFEYGKRSGVGMQIWRNKTYDGEWKDNKAHGKGRIVWQNGATYTGEFNCGRYHGLGVYVWPSGKKYVGSWEKGSKHGQGVYTFPSGKKYDGAYENGLKHGYGRLTWPDGRQYVGHFSKGKRDGRGIQTRADGSIEHCGTWKRDKPYIKGETLSPSLSICSNSLASVRRGQNTSDEDVVFMEAHSVAVADESFLSRQSARAAAKTAKDPVDSPTHFKSLAPSMELEMKMIPATPSKMDDMSSIGSCDQGRILESHERIEL